MPQGKKAKKKRATKRETVRKETHKAKQGVKTKKEK